MPTKYPEFRSNIPLLRQSYNQIIAAGEGLNCSDFDMTFEGYPELKYSIQTTQIPEMKREMIEFKGPHGVSCIKSSVFKNSGSITIAFKEVVSGIAYKALREIIIGDLETDITLELVSESTPTAPASLRIVLDDCYLELDGVDLSVDDGATIVRPTGTIYYNWVSWEEGVL